MPNIVQEALTPLSVTLTDPASFDPAALSQEVRDEIVSERMGPYRLLHKDLINIWQIETTSCDNTLDELQHTKVKDESAKQRLKKAYFKSRVMLFETEKKMAAQNIPLPRKRRTFGDILATVPITDYPAADEPVENKTIDDKFAMLYWLDAFDPSSLTLEEREEMGYRPPEAENAKQQREIVQQRYEHDRKTLEKALLRGLSSETCMCHLSNALHSKITLSLIRLRLAFNPQVFGERVRKVRTAAGDDIKAFASKVGRKSMTIEKWESGEGQHISNTDLKNICNFYGVNAEYLVGMEKAAVEG